MTSTSIPASVAAAPADEGPGSGKLGMWIFLVTDAMGFGGLLLAYGILRARADSWPDAAQRLSLPLSAGMTLALVTSSLTVMLALVAMRQGRRQAARAWLGVTVAAGLLFLAGQASEYSHLLGGPKPIGLTTDLPSSLFYVVTGFHGLHVVAGTVYLGILLMVSGRERIQAAHFEVAALFWHFIDFAWIPIFTFLYLLPANG